MHRGLLSPGNIEACHLTVAGFLHSALHFEVAMTELHYRDLIRRAVRDGTGVQLDLIVEQLVDAQRAREILRAKGYGASEMNASDTAAQVPDAAVVRFLDSLFTRA
jgi:hypothetical protein